MIGILTFFCPSPATIASSVRYLRMFFLIASLILRSNLSRSSSPLRLSSYISSIVRYSSCYLRCTRTRLNKWLIFLVNLVIPFSSFSSLTFIQGNRNTLKGSNAKGSNIILSSKYEHLLARLAEHSPNILEQLVRAMHAVPLLVYQALHRRRYLLL